MEKTHEIIVVTVDGEYIPRCFEVIRELPFDDGKLVELLLRGVDGKLHYYLDNARG